MASIDKNKEKIPQFDSRSAKYAGINGSWWPITTTQF